MKSGNTTVTHKVSIGTTLHMATTMLEEAESQVTLLDDGDTRTITFAFSHTQKIIGVLCNGELIGLSVVLQDKCQLSILTLATVHKDGHRAPLLDDSKSTTYNADLVELSVPLMTLRKWGLHGAFVESLLSKLSLSVLVADGKTNHYEEIAGFVEELPPVSLEAAAA